MVSYPITLHKDDDTVLVLFPDFPEAQTFGDDREEARLRAPDALATIIDAYIRARKPLPEPSRTTGEQACLSALMSAKVELYKAMHAEGVTKSELGRRLDWHLPQVDRLLHLRHESRLDQLESAFQKLDRCLIVTVREAATRADRRSRQRPKRSTRTASGRREQRVG